MEEIRELDQEFLEHVKLDFVEEPKQPEAESVEPAPEQRPAEEKNEPEQAAEPEKTEQDLPEPQEEKTEAAPEMPEEQEEPKTQDHSEEIRSLTDKMDGLENTVSSFHDLIRRLAGSGEATAKQLNQVNENLHKENQKLKEGLYDSLVMPVLKDVIDVGSNLILDINRYRKNGEDQIAEALESALDDVHILLERHSVEVYRAQEGEPYEPIIQKILKTVDTDEEQKDRTVAEVRSYGYRYIKGESSIVLTPCKVYVYKYKK